MRTRKPDYRNAVIYGIPVSFCRKVSSAAKGTHLLPGVVSIRPFRAGWVPTLSGYRVISGKPEKPFPGNARKMILPAIPVFMHSMIFLL
jgi:hypothetical protein